MTEKENGRRCYEAGTCPFHSIIEKKTDSALPKWVFISAFGTMITLAILFAGWHVNSLSAFDAKYQQNVERFNAIASQNKELLIQVKTRQDLILDSIEKLEKSK